MSTKQPRRGMVLGIVMSEFEVNILAKHYFPHFGEKYGRLCIIAVIKSHGYVLCDDWKWRASR